MKKRILLLSAIALLILIAVSFIIILNLPGNVAIRAVVGFADDLLEREEIEPIVEMLKEGSLELSVNDIKVNGSQSPEKISAAGKIYFAKDAVMLSGLDAKYNSFHLTGEAYLSRETVYVREDNILGGAYGGHVDTLADDLKKSIFAPNSGSRYSLDEEDFNSLIATVDAAADKEAKKDAEKLISKVVADLWRIVLKHAEISATTTDISLNGKNTDVRMISVVIDDGAMTNLINEGCDYLRSSKDIISFIEKHESTAVATLGIVDGTVEAYKEYVNGLESNIKSACESFETLTVNIATKKLGATLLQLEVKLDEETVFMIDCGDSGIKKTDNISLRVMDISACYTVKSDKTTYEGTITATRQGESLFEAKLNIDKESDSYTLHAKSEDNTLAVTGEWSDEGEAITVSVDHVKLTETTYTGKQKETSIDMTSSIIINTDDEMPAPNMEFLTVDNITDNDIKKLLNSLIMAIFGK
jgi:hypothetical protein